MKNMNSESMNMVKTTIVEQLNGVVYTGFRSFKKVITDNVVKSTNFSIKDVKSAFNDIIEEQDNIMVFAFMFNRKAMYEIPEAIAKEICNYVKGWMQQNKGSLFMEELLENVEEELDVIFIGENLELTENDLYDILF